MIELFFKLLIGHALADFAFQSDVMAKGKNRHHEMSYVPVGQERVAIWFYYLTAHALIHAGVVWAITGNVLLALAELVLHWVIDFAKCEGWINLHTDQSLHIICRVLYTTVRVL